MEQLYQLRYYRRILGFLVPIGKEKLPLYLVVRMLKREGVIAEYYSDIIIHTFLKPVTIILRKGKFVRITYA